MKLVILLSQWYVSCNPSWVFDLTYELDINEFVHFLFKLWYQLGTKMPLRLFFRQNALPNGQSVNYNFMV